MRANIEVTTEFGTFIQGQSENVISEIFSDGATIHIDNLIFLFPEGHYEYIEREDAEVYKRDDGLTLILSEV